MDVMELEEPALLTNLLDLVEIHTQRAAIGGT